jgi:hypothetical protein
VLRRKPEDKNLSGSALETEVWNQSKIEKFENRRRVRSKGMNVTTLPLLLFIFLSFIQSAPVDAGIGLGEEFCVNSGEEVVLKEEKLRIKFRSVTQDSRCPTGVICGWAGNGEVVLEVVRKNKKQVVTILNTLLEPKEIFYKGYKIRLVALNPYPKVDEPIDQKDYKATLVVTREE